MSPFARLALASDGWDVKKAICDFLQHDFPQRQHDFPAELSNTCYDWHLCTLWGACILDAGEEQIRYQRALKRSTNSFLQAGGIMEETFRARGATGAVHTMQWFAGVTRRTTNHNGTTGWARVVESDVLPVGGEHKVHLCAHNPCQAQWDFSKYGLSALPLHLQKIQEEPAPAEGPISSEGASSASAAPQSEPEPAAVAVAAPSAPGSPASANTVSGILESPNAGVAVAAPQTPLGRNRSEPYLTTSMSQTSFRSEPEATTQQSNACLSDEEDTYGTASNEAMASLLRAPLTKEVPTSVAVASVEVASRSDQGASVEVPTSVAAAPHTASSPSKDGPFEQPPGEKKIGALISGKI